MKLPTFNLPPIRDYFKERNFHLKIEQKVYQQMTAIDDDPSTFYLDSDVKRIFRSSRNYKQEIALQRAANAEISRTIQILTDENHRAKEPFEFFTGTNDPYPESRLPSSGIHARPLLFHR